MKLSVIKIIFGVLIGQVIIFVVGSTIWLTCFAPWDDAKFLPRLRIGMSEEEVRKVIPRAYIRGKLQPCFVEEWVNGVPIATNGYLLDWHNQIRGRYRMLYFNSEKKLISFPYMRRESHKEVRAVVGDD